MIKNLVTTLLSVVFLAACQSATREGGTGGIGGSVQVTPGTQADLEVNVGDRVFFDFDSSALHDADQVTLRKQAAWLQNYNNLNVTVEGHCDERGTREYNLGLGARRAEAAKKFLVSSGVDHSRISTISYGKERPAVLGEGEAVWSQNRRAVTVVNQ